MYHGETYPCLAAFGLLLIVSAQTTELRQPTKGPFYDPSPGQYNKAFGVVGSPYYLKHPVAESGNPCD
jgi:hypothetical protein